MADTGHLKTQQHELVKQYIAFDGNGRTEYIYTVREDGPDGCPCSVVRYGYLGVTTNVIFVREYTGVWDAAWELF